MQGLRKRGHFTPRNWATYTIVVAIAIGAAAAAYWLL